MKKMSQILVTIVIATVVAFGVAEYIDTSRIDQKVVSTETTYAHVMRTHILRCAYIVYPPEMIKDPNTGKLTGTIPDMMTEVGKQLGWNIEWTAEVGFADMFEGFKTGKYDALCSGLWRNPDRAKKGLFTIPTNYGIYYAIVRKDDHRFDNNLTAINDPKVRISIIDGEYGDFVAKESFPAAQTVRLPQLSDASMLLENVATGKADVVFFQIAAASKFMQNNPDKLKIIDSRPVRVMPAPAVVVPVGEHDLKDVLDAAFEFMLNNGAIEKILRHYDPELKSYNLVAKPYEVTK